MPKSFKTPSYPITVEIDRHGVALTYSHATEAVIQLADFKRHYKGPKGIPEHVKVAAVVDLGTGKFLARVINKKLI